ncbi:PucR family transcriptional regulator [Kyrpidia spormannii]|uniref:Transcriptional regulator, PucR family n=1 Tax=Kyrpidia spormannii TaxID=2055160 RepID=A0A6F9EHT1_9BACL|nr:PucR family transcriptional regulator [Kyrpidia spormannii]CAB3396048.1 Transcriptional regulator, PucR family [Kyrpidia spormannii]
MAIRKPFCVKDVLQRPIFQEAKLVAGRDGLDRPVRWVHVLEVTDAAELLHGEELILTTGVGLGRDESLTFQYVRGLIDRGVSGLCIELGKYFPDVPEGLRALGDASRFPIIVFERPVRFIDITQDIHAYLIDQHHDQLVELERISRQFLQLTLRPQGLRRILELLYRETGCPVRLQEEDGEVLVYPEDAEAEMASSASGTPEGTDPGQGEALVTEAVGAGEAAGDSRRPQVLCQPILAMDTRVGELSVVVRGKPSEFLHLVLDRAATAIAQEFLRRMSLEERHLRTTRRWMDDLLHRGADHLSGTAAEYMRPGTALVVAAILPLPRGVAVEAATAPNPGSSTPGTPAEEPGEALRDRLEGSPEDRLLLRAARILPRVFQNYGFTAWLSPVGNHWAVIAANTRATADSGGTKGMRNSGRPRGAVVSGTGTLVQESSELTVSRRGHTRPARDSFPAPPARDSDPARSLEPEVMMRIREALRELMRRLSSGNAGDGQEWVVGLGRIVFHPAKVSEAWRQATQALAAQMPTSGRPLGISSAEPCPRLLAATGSQSTTGAAGPADNGQPRISFLSYDDLYTWQVFLQMDEHALAEFVDGQIGSLLAHDRLHGAELVETARMFFACNQSKQQTAQALFIHRQTLYYRLEQIAALLGDGWNQPPRRLALEVAIDAARFLAARRPGRGEYVPYKE